MGRLWVVLGNQLFEPSCMDLADGDAVFMAEDWELCRRGKMIQHKIAVFLASMRSYADELRERGVEVLYHHLPETEPRQTEHGYERRLRETLSARAFEKLVVWEIEDKFFEERLSALATQLKIPLETRRSPMFLCSREEFVGFLGGVRLPRMVDFYRGMRRRLQTLVDADGKPEGGRWSFDADNRKRLPRDSRIPPFAIGEHGAHSQEVIPLVRQRFADHPGELSEDCWWFATNRAQARARLEEFLALRFADFGPYQDAITNRDPFLFHSAISPALNMGWLAPQEVLDAVLAAARQADIPINSVEGFLRQLIGWREFVRGIYQNYSTHQEGSNFFKAKRRMRSVWYTGDTGIPPLDDAIRRVLRYGWTHHIDRLMVLGALMNLSEIEPAEVHDWFMAFFVDSSDWVMGPNVYGMALFSDGGVFATKPYICGSSYLLKMSDYKKGPWCEIVDGLYWRFIDRHRDFFASQPRLSMSVKTLDRMDSGRRQRIFDAAGGFLEKVTYEP